MTSDEIGQMSLMEIRDVSMVPVDVGDEPARRQVALRPPRPSSGPAVRPGRSPVDAEHNPRLLLAIAAVALVYVVVVLAGGLWWNSRDSDPAFLAAGPTNVSTSSLPGTTAPDATASVLSETTSRGTDPAAALPLPGATPTTGSAGREKPGREQAPGRHSPAGTSTDRSPNPTSTSSNAAGTSDARPSTTVPGSDPGAGGTPGAVDSTVVPPTPGNPDTVVPGSPTTTATTPPVTNAPSTTSPTAPPTTPSPPTTPTTPVTTRPPLALSISITPASLLRRWEMGVTGAPVLTWSVGPAGALSGRTVRVTGFDGGNAAGLNESAPSGTRALCPGTVVDGRCTRSVGEWPFLLTVSDANGTVLESRTATLTVT